MNDLTGKYFVKNNENDDYVDVTTLFDGLRILKIDGFTAKGQAKNVYTASWEYDKEEDFAIVMQDDEDPVKIIRECTDLEITFIIKGSYATNTIDAQKQHLAFVDYMTNTDVWVKSAYQNNLEVHCVCLKEYKPTTEKYQRGTNSYVMGTISMHMMEEPTTVYLVNYTLDGVTTQYKAYGNQTFVLPLLPEAGKQIIPSSVTVTMGGTNITSTVYDKDTCIISIANVSGNISITASGITMAAEYKPVDYIEVTTKAAANRINLSTYKPNQKTKIVFDINMPEDETYTPLFSQSGRNMGVAASASDPRIGWYFRGSATNNGGAYWGSFYQMNSYYDVKAGTRTMLTIDCGSATYVRQSTNNSYTRDIKGSSPETWTSQYDIALFHLKANASANHYGKGSIYGVEISEDNATLFKYIPCKRISDGVAGLYDSVNGVYIQASVYTPKYL